MDRCNGRHDVTEILVKTALNTIKSINQSLPKHKTLALSKLEAFKDGSYNGAQPAQLFIDKVDNTVRKEFSTLSMKNWDSLSLIATAVFKCFQFGQG